MQRYRDIIILLMMIFMSGCGGGGSAGSSAADKPHEFFMKTDRTQWEEVNKPGESSLGVLRQSLDDGILEFDLTKGEIVADYYQFFIDTDNNDKTGYYSSGVIDGADYLIEEGRLYRSTANGTGWNWERVGSVSFSKAGDHVSTSVAVSDLENLNSHYRVAAIGRDENWDTLSYIGMKPISRGAVTVDADAGEWKNLPLWAQSGLGKVKITDDQSNLYFLIEKGDPGAHTQIYLDTDNNPETGYRWPEIGEDTGADYLIEDNRLYRSMANGTGWNWERIAYVRYAREGDTIEIAVEKSIMEPDSEFSMGVAGWDATFSNLHSVISMRHATMQNIKPLIISEVMAQNAHTKMDPDFYAFSDWMEIHNQTDNTIDLSYFMVSDKLGDPKWTIPAGTMIGPDEYLLIWADGEDTVAKALHTDFSFKSKGEAAALFDSEGVLVDGFKFGKQSSDISCSYDRRNGTVLYMEPTPEAPNSDGFETPDLAQPPSFSIEGGFYDGPLQVTISASDGAKIYYTTDGSYPTRESSLYDGAIRVDQTMVIRARAFREGELFSKEAAQTYLIHEDTTLPVISMALDAEYLFDDRYGIYAVGNNGTVNLECSGQSVANFNQEWKRPARITLFERDGKLGFSQEMDIKISGGCTRKLPQKSFSLKVDSKYGAKYVEYKLFDEKEISRFKGFKLRNSGQDWFKTVLRDGFLQTVVSDLDLDTQGYQPAILFINGRYWGIYNIREKRNEDYIAENHPGVDPDKVDLLYNHWDVKEGSADDYEALINFVSTHDLSDEENYRHVASKIEIANYIDYIITETFVSNIDWPYVNIKFWKEQKEGAKWRWILEDLDQSFSLWGDEGDAEHNMFEVLMMEENTDYFNPPWSTQLFRSLMQNDTFKEQFVSRYRYLLDTTFRSERVISILDRLKERIAPEIPRHAARWGDSHPWVFDSLDRWEENIEHIRDFANVRPGIVREQLEEMFDQ